MLIVLGFAWRPLSGGDDFWAHASIGRWILENGRIPRETLFLWSEKIPWIAHAWGTGIIFALLMRIGGESGGPFLAQALNALFCAAPFALLWRFYRRNARFSSWMAPLFVLAIWVSAARFHPRPELFTALFLTLLLLFLQAWPRSEKAWPQREAAPRTQIAGVLLMFAVWPNLHGAVAMGLVILWASALAELIQSRGDKRLLALAAICTLLMFVCNPRGFEYIRVIVPIASKTFERIDEWKPFWKWPALATELWVGELLLWAIGMALWLNNPNRRWMQLGWMLLMLAAFLQARRQLWLTALTSLFVIVSNVRANSDDCFRGWRQLTKGDIQEPIPAPMRLIARLGTLLILGCALAQAISKDALPPRAVSAKLPVRMASFLRDSAPRGHLFNDYEFSAYLQWAFHNKRGLFIDLNNAYPDSLMDEYFEAQASAKKPPALATLDEKRDPIMARLTAQQKAAPGRKISAQQKTELAQIDAKRAPLQKSWNIERAKSDVKRGQLLARRKIEVVSLRPFTDKEGLSVLGRYLDRSPQWRRLYRGNDGTVWARR